MNVGFAYTSGSLLIFRDSIVIAEWECRMSARVDLLRRKRNGSTADAKLSSRASTDKSKVLTVLLL